MEQTYFAKIKRAAKSECMNRRKIKLIILILTIAAALFEIGEYSVYNTWDPLTGTEDGLRIATYSGYFGVFLMFTAAFFGAFAVYGIFSDLTSRQTADVQLSLPMSSKDRYFSKLLALCEIHILPLAVAGAVVTFVGNVIHNSFDQIEYLLRYHMVVLAAALFVDAICVFCMCCCGARAEGVYTSFITGLCVSFTPNLFFTMGVQEFSGLEISSFDSTKMFSIMGLLNILWSPDISDDVTTMEPWLYLMCNMILSCLLIYASFYIYRKRDGRQVGKPMVYTLFMELFLFMGLFTLFTAFFYTGSWGIGLTIAAIIYLIIRIVSARAKITPKLFASWIGKYALSLAVFTVIMGAAYFTGGFGYYKMRQTKLDRDTIKIEVEVAEYQPNKESEYAYPIMVKQARFDNQFTLYSEDADYFQAEDHYNLSYSTIENKETVMEKLEAVNKIIDENYTLDDRSLEGFSKVMIDGSRIGRYGYNRVGTRVTVMLWNTNYVSNVDASSYSYSVTFWLTDEEFENMRSQFSDILKQTGSYYEETSRFDEQFDDYNWEIYDF